MRATYDGIGIIIRNNLHKQHQILSEFWYCPNSINCDMYTNDSLHRVCFLKVFLQGRMVLVVNSVVFLIFFVVALMLLCMT